MPDLPSDAQPPKRNFYFINEIVEDLLRQYIWTGCTSVILRDQIMSHASELIRQIIRKQGLHVIYPGQEESSFGDLLSTAWMQIERTLYKFRSRPHCRTCYNPDRPNDSILYVPDDLEYGIITFQGLYAKGIRKCPKCKTKLLPGPPVIPEQGRYGGSTTVLYRGPSKVFNMWSQISRTVILAYIKKEGRDRKNAGSYREFVVSKLKYDENTTTVPPPEVENSPCELSEPVKRFLAEARDLCRFNETHLTILDALEHLIKVDNKPSDSLISKLVEHSGMSRQAVVNFIKVIRLRSFEFTDSPLNVAASPRKIDRRKAFAVGNDDDD